MTPKTGKKCHWCGNDASVFVADIRHARTMWCCRKCAEVPGEWPTPEEDAILRGAKASSITVDGATDHV